MSIQFALSSSARFASSIADDRFTRQPPCFPTEKLRRDDGLWLGVHEPLRQNASQLVAQCSPTAHERALFVSSPTALSTPPSRTTQQADDAVGCTSRAAHHISPPPSSSRANLHGSDRATPTLDPAAGLRPYAVPGLPFAAPVVVRQQLQHALRLAA